MAKQEFHEEFISNPISTLQKLGLVSERRLAAIAYVTRDWLQFIAEDLLICDASDSAIETGRTSRKLLRELSESGVEIYSNSLLHAKVAVFDFATAFVGSANLSEFASQRIECGIVTNHPSTVEAIVRFVYRLQSESIRVDEAFLARIDELKVDKRIPTLPSQAKNSLGVLRDDVTGITYWIFKGTRSLSRNAKEAGDKMKAKWSAQVEEPTSDDFEEVSEDSDPLHFESLQHTDKRWVDDLQLGDRVLWTYESDEWGWIILPPRTVVSRRVHGKSLIAGTVGRYWDEYRSVCRQRAFEILGLPENAALRKLDANNEQLQQLLQRWDELVDD
jgi:PLD-like domain